MKKPEGLCECGCGKRTRICAVTDRTAGRIKGQSNRFINGHFRRKNSPTGLSKKRCECGCGRRTLFCSKTHGTNGVRKGFPNRFIQHHSFPAVRATHKIIRVPRGLSKHKCNCGCGGRTAYAPQTLRKQGWVKGRPKPFLKGHYKRPPLQQAFWQRVKKTRSCWLWQGNMANGGYGTIRDRTGYPHRRFLAHRLSYQWAKGPIPEGKVVRHKCDTPPCVRPSHLILGSHADNIRDKVGRNRQLKGEQIKGAKLNPEKVRAIRRLAAITKMRHADIGMKFGITQTNCSAIIRRKLWKHVA